MDGCAIWKQSERDNDCAPGAFLSRRDRFVNWVDGCPYSRPNYLTPEQFKQGHRFPSTQGANLNHPPVLSTAGRSGLRFHDLRHEATSRLYERTSLRDLEIASVTGHRDLRMLARYAKLKGSELAARMW